MLTSVSGEPALVDQHGTMPCAAPANCVCKELVEARLRLALATRCREAAAHSRGRIGRNDARTRGRTVLDSQGHGQGGIRLPFAYAVPGATRLAVADRRDACESTGRRPSIAIFEAVCFYLLGWASLEDVESRIAKTPISA